ncbi:hypothetical protein [Stratiformator vulcanicus]|uniref:Uncharacterized protein n=1 Tax=Stratiformator vulcanicus TaxID=2527980 RepID=A0A517R3S8_9PLAN|nr:hypothetical protein [Stratiformator vulcanicus]QDT38507.1 hypothetical protein Pan189_29010 [Stratiformator vulcanicus]
MESESLQPLKDSLKEWVESDVAEFELAVLLGLVGPSGEEFRRRKWVWWSNNPIGNGLHAMLATLVEAKVLEYDEESERYRFNEQFNLNE